MATWLHYVISANHRKYSFSGIEKWDLGKKIIYEYVLCIKQFSETPPILNGRLLWNTCMHMKGMEGSLQLKECWNLLQERRKSLVPKCNQLSFCTVLNAAIIFMETNNVWNMYNCTYRSVYVKMWVTESQIIQHWKFIKDKETVIILYTNNHGHIKAKDEGSKSPEMLHHVHW